MTFAKSRLVIGALALAGSSLAVAQPVAVAPSAPQSLAAGLPDYSYAGYRFGLAPLPGAGGTIINVTDHGVIPDDGKDDAKALLKALDAAKAVPGRVTIKLPKGRIQIGEVIPLTRSNLTLAGEGSGAGGTELYFPRPLSIVDDPARQAELRDYLVRENKYERQPDQNINFLFTEYSWAGGFLFVGPEGTRPVSYDGTKDVRDPVLTNGVAGRQFDRTLTVANASALRVGQVVQIQWFSDGPQASIIKSLYGDLSTWNNAQTSDADKLIVGSHHWTFPNRPVVGQPTRITAIRGNRVTLGDPLLHDVSASQPAVVANWQHLEEVGITGMRLAFPDNPWFGHHLEAGYNGMYLTGLFDGWVNDVVIHNSDSGILTDNAGSITIANVKTTGEHKAHYSVHIGAVHNVLARDIEVANPVVHPVSVNTRSSRSVYLRTTVLRDAILDQHSGSNHQNLFDNLTMKIVPLRRDDGWQYRLWEAGGAGYWKPGHGLYNTHWNIMLEAPATVPQDAVISVFSGLEGPGARIVGLHGNRQLDVNYRPTADIRQTNGAVTAIPSLYEYQLARRRTRR